MPHAVPHPAPDLLPATGLHEIHGQSHTDAASLSSIALMLGQGGSGRRLLWVRPLDHDRETGSPSPTGLAALGIDPARIIMVRPRDVISTLQAGLEGARCTALAAMILELWGAAEAYDLTASRRLVLAARQSGIRLIVTRIAAAIAPTAAETRWRLRTLPSLPLPGKAPGHPAFHLTLLRARNGSEGLEHHLEWDSHARQFIAHNAPQPQADHIAPLVPALSRPVAPLSLDRPDPPQPWQQAG